MRQVLRRVGIDDRTLLGVVMGGDRLGKHYPNDAVA